MPSKKLKRKMFKPTQKQEYIDFEGQNKDSLRRYFERIEPAESSIKKDLADMSKQELKGAISSLGIRREETIGHLISLLTGYIDWAMFNNKTKNKSEINLITPESINSQEAILKQMIKDPEDLQGFLDDAYDDCYENRFKIINLIFWLLYHGLDLRQMQGLKKHGLTDENVVLYMDEENMDEKKDNDILKFPIDEKTAKLWRDCCEITYVERKNSKAASSKKIDVKEYIESGLVNNDYLFRPVEGDKGDASRALSLSMFNAYVASVFRDREDGISIPPRNIKYSGIFYRLREKEVDGVEINSEIIAEYFHIPYKPEDKNELYVKTRKWKIDYEDWKLAFGYM